MQTGEATPQNYPAHSALPSSIWIDREKLGIIETIVEETLILKSKRERAQSFREIERVLKGLRLIPKGAQLRRLGLGFNYLGQQGLMLEFAPTEQVNAHLSNYAKERKDACTG